jgi:hypothetical protein
MTAYGITQDFGNVIFFFFLTVGVTDSSPEIWLLDRSLRWAYLASSFQNYFRMLIVHLGLPLWQYRFTQVGLSPETKVLQGFLILFLIIAEKKEKNRGQNCHSCESGLSGMNLSCV